MQSIKAKIKNKIKITISKIEDYGSGQTLQTILSIQTWRRSIDINDSATNDTEDSSVLK